MPEDQQDQQDQERQEKAERYERLAAEALQKRGLGASVRGLAFATLAALNSPRVTEIQMTLVPIPFPAPGEPAGGGDLGPVEDGAAYGSTPMPVVIDTPEELAQGILDIQVYDGKAVPRSQRTSSWDTRVETARAILEYRKAVASGSEASSTLTDVLCERYGFSPRQADEVIDYADRVLEGERVANVPR